MHKRAILWILMGTAPVWAFDPNSLPAVGYHPSGLSYWNTPYFCNAFCAGKWLEYGPGEWGKGLSTWDNPQFDANGYPRYLNPGKQLRGICWGLHINYGNSRPATWPVRSGLAQGRITLTWQGDADIRLRHGRFQGIDSSGSETGSLLNGERVYLFTGKSHLETLEIYAINPRHPITDIKVWLADPAQALERSLAGQLYHPTFLERLADRDWGFIRFMNLLQTNANPQQDWSDRRSPDHCFMTGPLNPRAPAPGFGGNRGTGMAFEHMVTLCNQTDRDLWLCIPHLATDDFVRHLAQLIRFGSDGNEPYTQPVSNPVYPPLAPHLRIYVEYSNEIWSNGNSFPQGNWAAEQGKKQGLSKAQFNARRFCRLWQIFAEVFTDATRLVNVAAVFTANSSYTKPYLNEVATYAPQLGVQPDIIAVTTYFGNGIQDYVYQKAQDQAGSDDPWCFTTETFGSQNKPVSLPASDSYWTSDAFARHQEATLTEWRKRLLSGDAREGAGPDAVGVGGGFAQWLRDHIHTTFVRHVPIVAYEGGPSIYTNNIDSGDRRDDGLTTFMEALNRHPGFRDVYNIHLNMASARGLWSHVAFTDCGSWGKYGQWGHLEYLDQAPTDAVKWQFLLDWFDEQQSLRHIDHPQSRIPRFLTPHHLPIGIAGQPYKTTIQVGSGDGPLAIEVVGHALVPGLEMIPHATDPTRLDVTGSPTAAGLSYLYLRVTDRDGDPAWRTFTLQSVGGANVLLESDFTGKDPAKNLPWTQTYVQADKLQFSGWSAGPGLRTHAGDDQLIWSVNAPKNEADATLSLALQDQEYLSVTLSAPSLNLAGARVTIALRRLDYHAPRQYAVFTNINGFKPNSAVYNSPYSRSEADQEFQFTLPVLSSTLREEPPIRGPERPLRAKSKAGSDSNESKAEGPDTLPYQNFNTPIELRLYGYSGQYANHKVALQGFRIEKAD